MRRCLPMWRYRTGLIEYSHSSNKKGGFSDFEGLPFFIQQYLSNQLIHKNMRKYLIYLMPVMIALSSCFGTSKSKDEELLRKKREQEAMTADSIKLRRSIPDTTLAKYKRTMFCDGKYMIVFDRVQLLSGEEAQEYAEIHKRYGNVDNVVINPKEVLETLPLSNDAKIYMYRQKALPGDSTAARELVRCYDTDLDDLEYDQGIELIIKQRTILHLKEMIYDKD